MKNIIPGNLDFSALNLSRDSSTDGDLEFDWSLIEGICEASGIDISSFEILTRGMSRYSFINGTQSIVQEAESLTR